MAPFVLFLALMALGTHLAPVPAAHYPVTVVIAAIGLFSWSRNFIPLRASRWTASMLVGTVVFVIWIGPDLLWPGYRSHWLFENRLTGAVASSLPVHIRTDPAFLFWRVAGSVVVVPIMEELFWRAWLMRYLASRHFEALPVGAATPSAFWISAVLFASEHGPYWDVGLAAGVLYNLWMVRTRSIADCIVAHAVTNACLAAYVVHTGQWQYWL